MDLFNKYKEYLPVLHMNFKMVTDVPKAFCVEIFCLFIPNMHLTFKF